MDNAIYGLLDPEYVYGINPPMGNYSFSQVFDMPWFGTFLTILLIIFAVTMIVAIISTWRIYTKANQPGWAAIIPVYSDFIFFRTTWGEGLYFLLLFVSLPLVPFIISVITEIKLARCFGKSDGFAVGLIFLPVIFLAILAFGKSEYQGPIHRLSETKND